MTSLRSRRQQLAPLAASSVTHEPTHKQINFMPGHDSWDVFGEYVSEEPGCGNPVKKNRWSTRVQTFLSTTARRLVEQDLFSSNSWTSQHLDFIREQSTNISNFLKHHMDRALEISQSFPMFRCIAKQFFVIDLKLLGKFTSAITEHSH